MKIGKQTPEKLPAHIVRCKRCNKRILIYQAFDGYCEECHYLKLAGV